jgi:hypothetical protein
VISGRKAVRLERGYRSLLYRRPIGIFSVLLILGVVVFSVGIALAPTKVPFPFYSFYVGVFSTLMVAIGIHWLLQSLTFAKKKEWLGAILGAGIGSVAVSFGGWLLSTAVTAFPR